MLRDRKPFHFIKLRKFWYAISILAIIPGVISLFTQGLNMGIDFKGGSLLEIRFNQPVATEQVREVMGGFGLADDSIQRSEETDFIIRTKELTEEESQSIILAMEEGIGEVTVQRNERVGPTIGRELIMDAFLALAVASVLMVIYIAWRFEFKQGIAAIISLLHDALLVIGIFSIFQIEVDAKFVAAILTVIGYSINDTIVIFDRIRENLLYRKKGETLADVANNSLWQTMTRSINTGLTVIFVLVAMFILGGATLHGMILAMLIGITAGVYSSVFNATPLWYDFKMMEKGAKA